MTHVQLGFTSRNPEILNIKGGAITADHVKGFTSETTSLKEFLRCVIATFLSCRGTSVGQTFSQAPLNLPQFRTELHNSTIRSVLKLLELKAKILASHTLQRGLAEA